jgi:hypothetical protein
LYYIRGQEEKLEGFHNFMHPKEIEAYELLRQNRILKDSELEPAIRIAIRAIKDFAFPIKQGEETYWKYLTVKEDEIKQKFEPGTVQIVLANQIPTEERSKAEETKIEIVEEEKEPIIESKQEPVVEKIQHEEKEEIVQKPKLETIIEKSVEKKIEIKPEIQIKKVFNQEQARLPSFDNPLAIKPEPKKEKIKPKSDFVIESIEFLNKTGFKILEEKEFKTKEYFCVAEINTDLGPIAFLTLIKDKKSVSDIDLDGLLRQAQSIPLPALFVAPGELNKKAKEYQQRFYSIIKFKKIE